MLYFETTDKKTLGLIEKLLTIDEFKELRLVGGTALALQIGHRNSVDIDLFGNLNISQDLLIEKLKNIGELKVISTSKTINIFFLDNIKLDIVNYYYKWIDKQVIEGNFRLASMKDIAAMKLSAITNRGSKKDFIDLYFLLKSFTIKQMIDWYLEKYEEGNEFLVIKSLGYFEDAEDDPMPEMFVRIDWTEIKNKIRKVIEKYLMNK